MDQEKFRRRCKPRRYGLPRPGQGEVWCWLPVAIHRQLHQGCRWPGLGGPVFRWAPGRAQGRMRPPSRRRPAKLSILTVAGERQQQEANGEQERQEVELHPRTRWQRRYRGCSFKIQLQQIARPMSPSGREAPAPDEHPAVGLAPSVRRGEGVWRQHLQAHQARTGCCTIKPTSPRRTVDAGEGQASSSGTAFIAFVLLGAQPPNLIVWRPT